ncbi:MAG: helix-turn-helix domain-containing protein [Nakamurella sp.]
MVESPKIGTKEFGDLLRTARERKGMSRNDLVEATGLSYPYISQLETAYRKPSPAAIQKLADALDSSLDEIFAAMTKPAAQPVSMGRRAADSGWIANESYADSPAPPPMGLSSAVGRPAPAPPPTSRAVPVAARSVSGAGPKAPSQPVIDQVVRLLTEIPADQRLDALAQVQSEVVGSVIDDGIRRGRSTS